jgi:hypothetical protein
LDYWVAYQAGYLLRLLELPPSERFDFSGTGVAGDRVHELLTAGLDLNDTERSEAPGFANAVAHWAMVNLRSYAIGLRIDHWIADEYPSLKAMQRQGMDAIQEENLRLLSRRSGKLTIPVSLLGPVAASALFADRLLGRSTYAIPYRAAGVLDLGSALLAIVDRVPPGAAHDRELVDAWADAMGMTGWYAWIPYKP